MNNFLKTIQPYISSEDPILQEFALRTIDKALLGDDETFRLALEANDKNPPVYMENKILPHTYHYHIGHEGIQLLINRLKKRDDNLLWYLLALSHCDPELLEEYYDEILQYVDEKHLSQIKYLIQLHHSSTKELRDELSDVLEKMEDERYYNSHLYTHSTRIMNSLIKKEGIGPEEVESTIRQELDKEYFSYKGILAVYAAGEMKLQPLVKDLPKLLLRDEEILQQENVEALIKIGSEEVIAEVAQYVFKAEDYFSPITILGQIKSDQAAKILLNLFDEAPDLTAKTVLAEALCQQLSIEAIPTIERLIEEGYNDMMLELEDDLYSNCIINGINHPKLQTWKTVIEKREARREERLIPHLVTSEKIGRNDPCPCGSGKKYKKCCGK